MKRILLISSLVFISGCVSIPQNAFVVTPELIQQRQLETRRFDGISEADLIVASANALQDLGFNLENSETGLGVITASKQRDAKNGGEIAAAVFVALLGGGAMAVSKDQTIRVSLVVRPVLGSDGDPLVNSNFARISFQRVIRRTDNSTFAQTMRDPELYQEFYERLSKSVFIEAQKV